MIITTGLDYLRTKTVVDCDTLDEQVTKTYGPFVDCTSNQAIAHGELSKPENAALKADSLVEAGRLLSRFEGVDVYELGVEIAMVKLALKIHPHITGHVHIQTNPYYSYSTEKTIVNALRIVQLFQYFEPKFEQTRICIKIPATWEGLTACRVLEAVGVHTLATTLFSMAQAVRAAEVGCKYVAPYVNQLRVHFEIGFTDPNKLLPLCVEIQKYYESINAKTRVLPASLTSTSEIYALAGVDHITIAPGLLAQLAEANSTPEVESLFDVGAAAGTGVAATTGDVGKEGKGKGESFVNDESAYRMAFTRDLHGASEEKLSQAINLFCDMQDKMVQIMKHGSTGWIC